MESIIIHKFTGKMQDFLAKKIKTYLFSFQGEFDEDLLKFLVYEISVFKNAKMYL